MSCARWITCPPLYSVEAIEASVEASVEASIEVASRLSVEAASRRRGQGSGSVGKRITRSRARLSTVSYGFMG